MIAAIKDVFPAQGALVIDDYLSAARSTVSLFSLKKRSLRGFL